MTKDEILAMETGKELDVLVAKEIFGIEVEWDYAPWDVNRQCDKMPFRKGEPRTVLGPMAHPISNAIPCYSTDISAAWLVVERMPSAFQIHKCLDDTWQVIFGFDTWIKPRIEGKTAPEAICKAALIAKLEVKE